MEKSQCKQLIALNYFFRTYFHVNLCIHFCAWARAPLFLCLCFSIYSQFTHNLLPVNFHKRLLRLSISAAFCFHEIFALCAHFAPTTIKLPLSSYYQNAESRSFFLQIDSSLTSTETLSPATIAEPKTKCDKEEWGNYMILWIIFPYSTTSWLFDYWPGERRDMANWPQSASSSRESSATTEWLLPAINWDQNVSSFILQLPLICQLLIIWMLP